MAKRYALVIGNSEYEDPELSRLKTPQADVRGLAACLRDPAIGGFDEVRELTDRPEAEVRRAIGGIFSERRPDDLVLLYFTGHGVLNAQNRLFLAVKDTQKKHLSSTGIAASFVTDEMDTCRSRRQILILDCCHSGAFTPGAKGAALAVTQATFEGSGYGRAVLTATDATQYALEGDRVMAQTELSLFSHFLIEGLVTGDADSAGDGVVSLDEWFDYASERVMETTPDQTPRKYVYNQKGKLIIAYNPHKSTPAPPGLPAEVQAVLNSRTPEFRLNAIAMLRVLLNGSDPDMSLLAHQALQKLADGDDSRKVAGEAARILAKAGARGAQPDITDKTTPPVETRMDRKPTQPSKADDAVRAIVEQEKKIRAERERAEREEFEIKLANAARAEEARLAKIARFPPHRREDEVTPNKPEPRQLTPKTQKSVEPQKPATVQKQASKTAGAPVHKPAQSKPTEAEVKRITKEKAKQEREQKIAALIAAAQDARRLPEERLRAADEVDSLWLPGDLYDFHEITDGKRVFFCAKYPVTNLQYARFLKDPQYGSERYWKGLTWYDPDGKPTTTDEGWNWFKKVRLEQGQVCPRSWEDADYGKKRRMAPVVHLTWFEASAYCKWLLEHWQDLKESGANPEFKPASIRLLQYSEWAAAAGGDSPSGRYPWDEDRQVTRDEAAILRRANIPLASSTLKALPKGVTTPVWMFPYGDSPYGIADMAGNAREWLSTAKSYAQLTAPKPTSARFDPTVRMGITSLSSKIPEWVEYAPDRLSVSFGETRSRGAISSQWEFRNVLRSMSQSDFAQRSLGFRVAAFTRELPDLRSLFR